MYDVWSPKIKDGGPAARFNYRNNLEAIMRQRVIWDGYDNYAIHEKITYTQMYTKILYKIYSYKKDKKEIKSARNINYA